MSTAPFRVPLVEITEENLENLLQEDDGFVDFFNTFLALPCFAERLFYNREKDVFEEFIQTLADDKGQDDAKSTMQQHLFTDETKYDSPDNQSQIGYYVTVIKKPEVLQFLKKHRLHLFLRSELFAEYKLSKHLSSVQDSFFLKLPPDDDIGVEEPTDLYSQPRRRSGVSFNLSPSLEDKQSTDGTECDSNSEGQFYLPTHVRSIEETFDAWQQSFKRQESRTSAFGSGASSPNQNTSQIVEQEEELDAQSCSTEFSAKESDVAFSSHERPTSCISFVSDHSTSQKKLNGHVKSRVSSANTVSFFQEIEDQPGVDHENLNEDDVSKSEKSFGAVEMTRSLTSAVGFITEHGHLARNSPLLEDFCNESSQYDENKTTSNSKRNSSAPISGNAAEEEGELQIKLMQSKQNLISSDKKMFQIKPETTAAETVGDSPPAKTNVTSTGVQLTKDVLLNDEKQMENDDKGTSPSFFQTIARNTSGAKGQDKEIAGSSRHPDVEDDSIKESLSHSFENDGSYAITEERLFYPNAEYSPMEGEGEQAISNDLIGEMQSLPSECQSSSLKSEVTIPALSLRSIGGSLDSKESTERLISYGEKVNPVFSGHNGQENTESKWTVNEQSSEGTELPSHVFGVKNNFSKITEDIQETTEKGSLNEREAIGLQDELHEFVPLDGEDSAKTWQKDSEPDEFQNKSEHNDEDDEGGYITEASGQTLQGIRGVFGPKLTRCSTAATSVGLDMEDESALSEDGSDTKHKPYNLATKEALDAFKEFLLDTSGEKLLQFWLEVESGRFIDNEDERNRLVQSIRDRFCKSGGIYEFATATKTRLNIVDGSKITYDGLFVVQPDVLEPLLSYWCVRFSMHQQRRSHSHDVEYNRLTQDRPKSCVKRENTLSNLPQVPGLAGMTQALPEKPITRPLSGTAKQRTRYQTSRPQVRAKSAHPRLLHFHKHLHTNANTQQLEFMASPVKTGYGFEQPPGPSFPVEPKPDYLSSVRLFINPFPSPDSKMQRMMRTLQRTAVFSGSTVPNSIGKETGCMSSELLDSLIQGLIYERQTGNYFQVFLQKSGNKTWLNCLAFWKSLQEYNAYFFADSLNPSLLSKKAKSMYANFVVPGSCQDVQVTTVIQEQVRKELDPPYEELFDAVEEHVLYSLLQPWNMLMSQERNEYTEKVPKERTLQHIEIKVMARRRHSVIYSSNGLVDTEDEQDKERISVDEANRQIPIPKDGFTFETLIKSRDEVEYFKEFLSNKHTRGIKDLMAWTDMETFRRISHSLDEKRDKKAREIRDNWLGKKYFFGPDSPATREGRNLIMNLNGGRPIKERPGTPVILESQKFVRARIERRWLMLFKQTVEFIERQKPRVASVPEMVEDIMLKRRLQRSEAAWKILNSRWVSSSRDVVALRQTLLNPDNCSEFTAYVAMKGDTLESNVHFWLEVQKFKDLCHSHAQPALIYRKVQTIIECFLNSAIAPELQIDIPIEMAEKLMEKLSGRTPSLHPYVFREAQMTVFRVLFNHWKEFATQRSKIPEGVNPREYFAELLRRHRADTKSKKEASERRRLARLSAERKKKEKEEREKKRIEDFASLFSTESASVFYTEDDDLRSWFYSKYLVEQERQEHIKRLREQGINVPEEDLADADREEAKSRRSRASIGKSSTLSKTVHDALSDQKSSEGSSRKNQAKLLKRTMGGQLSPSLARHGSAISSSLSLPRRYSGESLALSRKDDKMSTSGKVKITVEKREELSPKHANVEMKNERNISEIQVFPETLQNNKLLPQRPRTPKQQLPNTQIAKSATTNKKLVSLDAVSCISDYSILSNVEFASRKTATEKKRHQEGTSPLTFKSLKDFTNSPEGAQLSMPLPLVRITSASHHGKSDTDGSVGETSPVHNKTRPLPQQMGKKVPIRPGARKRLGPNQDEMQILPDVVVN